MSICKLKERFVLSRGDKNWGWSFRFVFLTLSEIYIDVCTIRQAMAHAAVAFSDLSPNKAKKDPLHPGLAQSRVTVGYYVRLCQVTCCAQKHELRRAIV